MSRLALDRSIVSLEDVSVNGWTARGQDGRCSHSRFRTADRKQAGRCRISTNCRRGTAAAAS
jgi:hypothetical protein